MITMRHPSDAVVLITHAEESGSYDPETRTYVSRIRTIEQQAADLEALGWTREEKEGER
jgi:hypothetical protein